MSESGFVDASRPPNPLFVWVRDAAHRLASIDAGNPRLEAEYLMAAALRIPRIRLWLVDDPPDARAIERFEALLARRLAREPLQYVLGTAEFAGLTLQVGPGVFIPRSETEILVERVADRLGSCESDSPVLVDVGTGSGAVLLALLSRLPRWRGIGVDRSAEALIYALRNVGGCAARDRVRMIRSDLLAPFAPIGRFDAIVSNPPYILEEERGSLAPEIALHEPHEALFAGPDGLATMRRMIPQAADRLKPGGLLALEIGITQSEAVTALLPPDTWGAVAVHPDLTGRPRVVLADRL